MLVSATEVFKSFGKKKVLNGINFYANKGEIIGLIGPSGAGKSVFIKILIGFLKPDHGEVVFDRHSAGFSMQNNSLYDYLTVKQNMAYFSKIYGAQRKTRKEIIAGLMNRLDLADYKDVLVQDISGGTKKRVDIACALVHDPDLVILDEPLLGLDPRRVDEIIQLIIDLKKEGRTIIVSSHILDEISKICDKIILIKDGKSFQVDKSRIKEAYG